MKSGILLSAIAAGTAVAAGVVAYLKRDKLPSWRSVKRKVSTMMEKRPTLPERYSYDHLRFGGLE